MYLYKIQVIYMEYSPGCYWGQILCAAPVACVDRLHDTDVLFACYLIKAVQDAVGHRTESHNIRLSTPPLAVLERLKFRDKTSSSQR